MRDVCLDCDHNWQGGCALYKTGYPNRIHCDAWEPTVESYMHKRKTYPINNVHTYPASTKESMRLVSVADNKIALKIADLS